MTKICLGWMILGLTAGCLSAGAAEVHRQKGQQWETIPVTLLSDVAGFASADCMRLNRFGGRADRCVKVSGFFRTEKINGRWWLVDWWSGQTTPDIWIEWALDLADRWKPMLWAAEAGVIRRSVEPFLTRRMHERRTYCKIEWVASISDKPTRARGFVT